MESVLVVRSMCIKSLAVSSGTLREGQVYTVRCRGTVDWGLDYRTFEIEGVRLSPEVYEAHFEQVRTVGVEQG